MSVELFRLTMKKMNTTVVFFQPSLNITFEAGMTVSSMLTSGKADVVVGMIPYLPVLVTGMTDPSLSFDSSDLKWFVPCPKSISRVDRFLTVFDASVWLTMIIVFVLTSALFWFTANYTDRIVEIDSKKFQTIP